MKRQKSPAQVRLEIARGRRQPGGSALVQLQLDLLGKSAAAEFESWRTHPMTLLMVDCLRELSMTPPAAYVATPDIGVQYGVSSGLSLASAFMSDPRTLYPFLFSGAAPGDPRPVPEADYVAEADSGPGGAK